MMANYEIVELIAIMQHLIDNFLPTGPVQTLLAKKGNKRKAGLYFDLFISIY